MPVTEKVRHSGYSGRSLSDLRHRMDQSLNKRLVPAIADNYGYDASQWGVARLGRTWWIVDGDLKPLFGLGNTAETALAHLQGLSHGLRFDSTLSEHTDWDTNSVDDEIEWIEGNRG